MSTKFTIRSGDRFHLYEDWLDECIGANVVNLRLDGVFFEATPGSITIAIPRDIARELGIILQQPEPEVAP